MPATGGKMTRLTIIKRRVKGRAMLLAAGQVIVAVAMAVGFAFGAQEQPKQEVVAIKTVEVTPGRVEAQVGQHIKFAAVAKDTGGNLVEVKQIIWFAGPFDLAAADDTGNVTLYGPGEVEVGAMIRGKVGRAKIIVKPQPVASIEVAPVAGPLVVGGTVQLSPSAR